MWASFRPPSVPAIWKTDLEWGSIERKDLHVLTKHKHAVVSISFPGNEQIPEPVGMCNQEFERKLPGVQPRGVNTDIFSQHFLISQYTVIVRTLYFSFLLCFMVSLGILPCLLRICFLCGPLRSLQLSSKMLPTRICCRVCCICKNQNKCYMSFTDSNFGIHTCHFFAGLCTLSLSRHLEESDDVKLLSGTPKAYVTHSLISSDSSFHR